MPVEERRVSVVIVGPGAIGCLFAALLADGGARVQLLDKDPRRAARIAASGLQIEESGTRRTVAVPITADAAEMKPADFVCVCVKAYDTGAAVAHARRAVGAATVVVSLQNGLGNAEAMATQAADRQLVCAVTAHGATVLGEGRVRHAGRGPTQAAPYHPEADAGTRAFVRLLEEAGIAAAYVSATAPLLWSKLVVNAAINPVTALHQVTNGHVLRAPRLRATACAAAREAAAVARGRGIQLPFEDAAGEVQRVCRLTAANTSSMLQDIRRGKRTEIDAINGAVTRHARAAGIPTPVNARLCARIHAVEAGDPDPGER